MGGHVVRTLGGVRVQIVAIFHQPGHPGIEVGANARVCVLTKDQRGTGVLDEQVADAVADAGFVDRFADLPGDIVGSSAARREA